ncbi:hypothetical protein GCM10011349_36500 [Novosphingobium indicum]|uniref:Uncharacterized protein n=1 Tax=Novosphingobium indicum TaxID=462949 RepID=A0ABQ2JUF2_9SPHN|nr:alkaline phosphatase family protein [Novosphingobium indicum]GGN57692.1 hypothetical protein GCM10011349_36500 [Novosphingobium indicum]
MTVLSLEMNELNFHYIEKFIEEGKLPNFGALLAKCQLTRTIAEKAYPDLEPWIQWPTVYSGKTYAEHGIFRLGDIVSRDYPQIWEALEQEGLRVGAISPMNAANRCENPCFFLPDPWTNTDITADDATKKLWKLVASIVNSNASNDLGFAAVGKQLAPLAMRYVNAASTARYTRVLLKALRYKWAKAAFLDVLLFDLAMKLKERERPDYMSLFLNAGAHIQHHHTYDSSVYSGEMANPEWYSKAAANDEDPLLFIYEVYDDIIGECMRRSDLRVLITTGLSQTPNPREHYQYRMVEFDAFLGKLGVTGAKVLPRMSRDFLLEFEDRVDAEAAIAKLTATSVGNSDTPLIRIEDRGLTLFCQVCYFGRPEGLKAVQFDGRSFDASDDLVLVSIENAIHQTTGYHVDMNVPKGAGDDEISLTEVFNRLKNAALAESGALTKLAG